MKKNKFIEKFIGQKDLSKDTEKTWKWYKSAFNQREISGDFTWKWSWWAFLGNWLYLLYRKCYTEAIAYFLIIYIFSSVLKAYFPKLSFGISQFILFISILAGGLLHNIIHIKFLKAKTALESSNLSEEQKLESMEKYGGVDKKAVIIGVISYLLIKLV